MNVGPRVLTATDDHIVIPHIVRKTVAKYRRIKERLSLEKRFDGIHAVALLRLHNDAASAAASPQGAVRCKPMFGVHLFMAAPICGGEDHFVARYLHG